MRLVLYVLCLLTAFSVARAAEPDRPAGAGVVAAAVRAIEIARDQQIFTKPFIISSAPTDGGVSVTFRTPVSNVMVAPGQKQTENLFNILVRETDAVVSAARWRVAQADGRQADDQPSLAMAAARTVERLYWTSRGNRWRWN